MDSNTHSARQATSRSAGQATRESAGQPTGPPASEPAGEPDGLSAGEPYGWSAGESAGRRVGCPDRLAALADAVEALASQDLGDLTDVALAEEVLALRRLVDRLEGRPTLATPAAAANAPPTP
jgi:hypothetical protein